MFDEEIDLFKILSVIENIDLWDEISFKVTKNDDGEIRIKAIDKHGTTYEYKRRMG